MPRRGSPCTVEAGSGGRWSGRPKDFPAGLCPAQPAESYNTTPFSSSQEWHAFFSAVPSLS